ncbi:MAG: helix-turn-helix transcriptional regulator [Firmicutes bacterium]|nr:helix-turn-helix transcriptional regulator [Bacillota bacterium]
MDTLGAKLKKLRENRKISLRKLGGMAHLSHSFIADIESGRSNPSIDTLNALAKALDVPVTELIGKNANQTTVDIDSNIIQTHEDLPPEALKEIEDFQAYIRYKYKKRIIKQGKS